MLVMSQASSSDTTPKIYLILLRRSMAFKILQHIKNSGEGFVPPLVPRWGVNLRYIRGLNSKGDLNNEHF